MNDTYTLYAYTDGVLVYTEEYYDLDEAHRQGSAHLACMNPWDETRDYEVH